jgi:hypothetical protein
MALKTSIISVKTIWKGCCLIYEKKEIALDFRYVKPSDIVRFNFENGEGRDIAIGYVHTDSTGMLAPLDGMILVGQVEFPPDESTLITLWEWQSGIPLPTTTATAPEEPALTNTTTTTNASADTNSTAAEKEEAVEGAEVAQ